MKSRAVLTTFLPRAESPLCRRCGVRIGLQGPKSSGGFKGADYVLANIYRYGRWIRRECYHPGCYVADGEPWGLAEPQEPRTILELRDKVSRL